MPLFGPPDIQKLKASQNVRGLAKAVTYPKDAAIREKAARALQEIGDSQATKALIAALKDENEYVRREAVKALGKIGDAAAVPALLRVDFRSGYKTYEELVYPALLKIGSAAVDSLCISLKDKELGVRCCSARALGLIGDRRAVEPLCIALQDEEFSVRSCSARALGQIGDSRAVEPLGAVLKAKNGSIPKEVTEALAKIKDPRAIPLLIAGLQNYNNRDACRKALVSFGESAVDTLIGALEDEDEHARAAATAALADIGSEKAIRLLIPMLNGLMTERPAREGLLNIGLPAVEPLIDALRDKNQNRHYIAYLLGKLGDPRATLPLTALLEDEDERVRFEAAQALGWIKDPRAVPALIDALQKEAGGKWRVRETAQKSLANIGKAAVDPMMASLQNPDQNTRRAACETLQEIGWEPETDHDRVRYWLANNEVYQLRGLDIREIQDILMACVEWDMDWYAKGRLAQLLLHTEMSLPPAVQSWAEAELESYFEKSIELIKSRLETPQTSPWIDEIEARVLFEDYAGMVSRASAYTQSKSGFAETYYSYNTKFSLSAVQKLCQIKSPVSSNLLHHLRQLSDIEVVKGVYECEYDSDHPTGMASVDMTLSFQAHRHAAEEELARRGNPAYDPAIYRDIDCWKIEGQ